MSPRKSVSDKNTKTEILAAYHELLTGAGEQPVLIKEDTSVLTDLNDVGGEATKQLAELKLGLAREIDKMNTKLAHGIEAVQLQEAFDALLGSINIIVGSLKQFYDDVFNIFPHISRLCQGGSICHRKGNI